MKTLRSSEELYLSATEVKTMEFKPVMGLKGRITRIHTMKKDEGISYGYSFIAPKDTKVATIPIGYADGIPRALSNKIYGKINGTKKKLHISPTTTTNNLKLNTAITLYSEVIDLRNINKNDFVGYGALYTAQEPSVIATIPIGYADGIPKNIKHVAINNKIMQVQTIAIVPILKSGKPSFN